MADQHHNDFAKDIQRDIMRRSARAAVLAGVSFIIGLVIFGVLIAALQDFTNVEWGMLEGIMSLVSTALLVGGSVFALREYINNEIQQKREELDREEEEKKVAFNVYKEIFDRLMSPEDVEARRWIIQNVPRFRDAEDAAAWFAEVQAAIHRRPPDGSAPPGQIHLKRVLNTFDFIGFVGKYYWPIKAELLQWMSPPIAKVWERIGPYVHREADTRHEPDYYRAARDLGEQCTDWWSEHYPDSTIINGAT